MTTTEHLAAAIQAVQSAYVLYPESSDFDDPEIARHYLCALMHTTIALYEGQHTPEIYSRLQGMVIWIVGMYDFHTPEDVHPKSGDIPEHLLDIQEVINER